VYRPKCIKDEGTTCPDREAVKQRQQHVSVYKLLEVWVHQLNLVCGLGFARSVLFDNLDDLKVWRSMYQSLVSITHNAPMTLSIGFKSAT
jgi:hypothetical protein